MERSSPIITRVRWGLLAVVLGSAASGCVLGNDSDPPILSVDLLWDRSMQNNRFSRGTCASSGVIWMNWQLKDLDDHVIASTEDEAQECEDGFDFVDVGPGEYTLTVMGYDDADQALWNSTCEGLVVERFDTLYECEVDKAEP